MAPRRNDSGADGCDLRMTVRPGTIQASMGRYFPFVACFSFFLACFSLVLSLALLLVGFFS